MDRKILCLSFHDFRLLDKLLEIERIPGKMPRLAPEPNLTRPGSDSISSINIITRDLFECSMNMGSTRDILYIDFT